MVCVYLYFPQRYRHAGPWFWVFSLSSAAHLRKLSESICDFIAAQDACAPRRRTEDPFQESVETTFRL
jgi:hypothetical protein